MEDDRVNFHDTKAVCRFIIRAMEDVIEIYKRF